MTITTKRYQVEGPLTPGATPTVRSEHSTLRAAFLAWQRELRTCPWATAIDVRIWDAKAGRFV